jgi:hypothetical protein
MPSTDTPLQSALLADIPFFIYGTTRLGDGAIPFDDRVRMARLAMDAGIWFHTSHTYGNALEVLRKAFDQARAKVPKLIVKLLANTVDELESVIRQNTEPLGLDSLELGQLCFQGKLAEDLANGGAVYRTLSQLKEQGRVRRFVLEVFPWTSDVALKALRGGHTRGVVDGVILYLNPLQRFASNELWDLILKRNEPVIALRTVAGGDVHRLRDVSGAAWKPYLQERAVQVAPVFERSGIKSWAEFCLRFVRGFPQVRATVGATCRAGNFQELLAMQKKDEPLPPAIQSEILKLQQRWSDELDMRAEPWSM